MAPIEVRDRSLVIDWAKSLPSSGAEEIRARQVLREQVPCQSAVFVCCAAIYLAINNIATELLELIPSARVGPKSRVEIATAEKCRTGK